MKLLLTVFVLFHGQTGYADSLTIGAFKKRCRPTNEIDAKAASFEDVVLSFSCLAYIDGINDGAVAAISLSNAKPIFCLPQNGVDSNGAVRMLRDYIKGKNLPDELPIRGALLAAYANYFPCPS